jgi:dephospho-CoA kinase
VAVVDVPLLYEVNVAKLFDAVIVVAASRVTQLARLRRGRGLSRREAEGRLNAQWPLQRKIDLADYVIWNDGSPALLRKQVNQIWKTISRRPQRSGG